MGKISYIDDFKTWSEGFQYYSPTQVRFSETDLFGHLNNTVAFVYFEQARVSFFKDLGFMDEWMKENSESLIVTADLQCDFLKQIYVYNDLKIYVKVHQLGNTSLDLHYKAEDENGEACLAGRGRIVHISKAEGKPLAWTDSMKAKLQEYVG
ncbi:thioesterase family protein [Bacillus tianshenii]|nr:thioesterase family protein [Bacillus tianshenii]